MTIQSVYHEHDRCYTPTGEDSLTKQSFRDECNVNNIMAKFEKTGLLDHLNTHQGDYGNFIGFDDYHSSMNQVREADEAFLTIPAAIRARFNNSSSEFLKFAQDPDNHDQMVDLGLAIAKPPKPDPLTERAQALKTKSGGNTPKVPQEDAMEAETDSSTP